MSGNSEDLLIRARQCLLDEDEEKEFEVAVQSSRELEALYNAGVQFDEDASVLPGDETRSADLVARTLARLDERRGVAPPPRRRGWVAAALAAAALLSVAIAGAWGVATKKESPAPIPTSVATSASPLPAPVILPAPPPPSASASAAPAVTAAPAPAVLTLTASQLFARANERRREGDIKGAIATYERLCSQYPNSVEAEDAKVLMGNLLLSERSPRAALQKFETYDDGGALSLEALWGRAEALRKLQSPDERAVLEKIVRDYPTSPYAAAAQKRLREL